MILCNCSHASDGWLTPDRKELNWKLTTTDTNWSRKRCPTLFKTKHFILSGNVRSSYHIALQLTQNTILHWDRSIFQHFNFHLNSLCAPGWIRGSAVYRLTHERFAILCIPLTSRVVPNFTFYYLINWLCSCGSLLSTFRSDPGVKLGIWLALKAVTSILAPGSD